MVSSQLPPPYNLKRGNKKKTSLSSFLAQVALVTGTYLGTMSAPAMALTFNWSFTTGAGSTGGAGQVVSGTIDGLNEGSNNGSGLTVTVTSTPDGTLTGGGWTFVNTGPGGDAFTVSSGAVTFADARFDRSGQQLFFGGYGGFTPQLRDSDSNPNWFNSSGGQTTFTPAVAIPFEVDSSLGLIIIVGAAGVYKIIKKFWHKDSNDKK